MDLSRTIIRWRGTVAVLVLLSAVSAWCKPQSLHPKPIPSPDGKYYANVEWDDVGFIGLVRMRVWNRSGQLVRFVELPEIGPDPANLMWLDEDWVACESFIGTRGSGFFYVHAPTGRGYLLEIVEPHPNADWVFTLACNDAVSTAAVGTVSRGKSSVFPVQLRNVPQKEVDYFTVEFAEELALAGDAFVQFRRAKKFQTIEPMGDADIRPNVGGLAVCRIDQVPHAVYFPTGTTSTLDMLSRVQWQPLPETAARALRGPDPPRPIAKWLDAGEFVIEGVVHGVGAGDNASTRAILMKSRFADVHDQPFIAPSTAEGTTPVSVPAIPSKAPHVTVGKSTRAATGSGKSPSKKPSTSK